MPNKLSTYGQVTLLAFSALGLTSNPAWAEKDMDYINALKSEAKVTNMADSAVAADNNVQKLGDALSESDDLNKDYIKALKLEAKATDMTDQKMASDNIPEPAVTPSQSLDMQALTQRVTKDIQRVLATNNNAVGAEANVQDDIEQMVSSSLEDGHKMDDIRSAVSGAMASLKAQPKRSLEAKKLESVSSALNQVVGKKSDRLTGNPKDNYIHSLDNALAETVSVDHTSFSQARTITVMKGESLYKVSMRLYGVGDYYMALYEANRDIINNPNDIKIGQVLRVPE